MSNPERALATSFSENSYKFIPGGVSSINRLVSPSISFARGQGAYIWDSTGRKYVDFHAAFAPFLLGHNHDEINRAVIKTIKEDKSLFGSGPIEMEGELAELLCNEIDAVEKITFLNTGSEATALAVKLARAVTSRDHIIVVQGSYNGNSDELACNVANSLDEIGTRVSPGEYPIQPLGTGTVIKKQKLVHIVNFNDPASIRFVCEKYPVAALITEPVLQNIGIVKPADGYLKQVRSLADELGFLMILDEVKTGFRQGLGGYAAIANVVPDLVTYGKAIANGYPLATLGGKAKFMDVLASENLRERPLLAGTYNGHPVGIAAAIATVKYLKRHGSETFERLEQLGKLAENGITEAFSSSGIVGCVARLGSAFSFYFMDHCPVDYHDLLINHDSSQDVGLRRKLIEQGIYFVPVATKQCSISVAHNERDIELMVQKFKSCVS